MPTTFVSMRTPAKAQRTAAPPATPRWLTISMVATILAVSEDTVYTMIREGRLPAVRIRDVRGAALRINEADLGRLLSESYVTYPNWDGSEIRGRR
ncbi:MAG: helix-turn-helix domain-containing protein [Isosphaeraceae bacterium]